ENVDLHKPATFRPPQIRAAPDVDPSSVRKDREERARAHVSNPGQSEFEVKYEHESVWTTAPRRDVDQTPTKKKS
ncbi:MAG TPA: hypothetical protein VI796_03245, partial [Candidatus Thermoplasmatota archaeon]|nr:hypothetical protein [Candidatus Thermoplasmatota archaeon]